MRKRRMMSILLRRMEIQKRKSNRVVVIKTRTHISCLRKPWANSTQIQWCTCNTTKKECTIPLGCHLIQECIPISRCPKVSQCIPPSHIQGKPLRRRGIIRANLLCLSLQITLNSKCLEQMRKEIFWELLKIASRQEGLDSILELIICLSQEIRKKSDPSHRTTQEIRILERRTLRSLTLTKGHHQRTTWCADSTSQLNLTTISLWWSTILALLPVMEKSLQRPPIKSSSNKKVMLLEIVGCHLSRALSLKKSVN